VTVLTEGPLSSTVRGLAGISLAQLQQAPGAIAPPGAAAADRAAGLLSDAVARELDVFICWGDAEDPFSRAGNRRDAIYASITGTGDLRAVAAVAAGLRARRLLLLAPLIAWQQVSAASRMLPEAMEMELARLPIPSIVIMRPTIERQSAGGGSRMQRFVRFYLSQLRFMLPAVTHSLRSSDIARAALAMMAESDAVGLTIVPLDRIRRHASKTGVARDAAAPAAPTEGESENGSRNGRSGR
jgi:hypothetical protein